MVDGDVNSASTVTHTRIAVTQDDGTVVIKQVLESLDTPHTRLTAERIRSEVPPSFDDPQFEQMDNMSPPPTRQQKRCHVSICWRPSRDILKVLVIFRHKRITS